MIGSLNTLGLIIMGKNILISLYPQHNNVKTLFNIIKISIHLIWGTRILFMPPNFTLIFKHKLEIFWVRVLTTFVALTHWVGMPKIVSPTRLTSAEMNIFFRKILFVTIFSILLLHSVTYLKRY